MTRFTALVLFLIALSACGGNDAAPPTSPSPTVFSISGMVFGNGTALAGASVTITDGLYAGQIRDTTNDGHYRFAELTPSTMTLQANFPGYFTQSKTVTVTSADQSVDFIMSDQLRAINEPDPLEFSPSLRRGDLRDERVSTYGIRVAFARCENS